MGKSISGKMRKPNEFVIKGNYAEGILYDIKHNPKGVFLISIEDLEEVSKHRWTEIGGYIATYNGKKHTLLHRFLIDCPNGLVIDHINRNKKDNRRENLRVCTQSINAQNKEFKLGKSQTRYIAYDKSQDRYKVQIGKQYIGQAKTLERAKEILELWNSNQ